MWSRKTERRSSRTTQIVLKTRPCGLQNKYQCHSSLRVTPRLNFSWHFHQNQSCGLPIRRGDQMCQRRQTIGSESDAHRLTGRFCFQSVLCSSSCGLEERSWLVWYQQHHFRESGPAICGYLVRSGAPRGCDYIVSLFVGRQRTLSSGPFFFFSPSHCCSASGTITTHTFITAVHISGSPQAALMQFL